MVISEIEISPSDRAKCCSCGNLIEKGTPRGCETIKGGTYTSERYFCYKCTLSKIDSTIHFQKELKQELKKLIRKQTKEIIASEL